MASPCAKGTPGVLLEVNNGSGPPVYFEIHGHPRDGIDVYNTTRARVSGAWTAPVQERHMVYWRMINRPQVKFTFAFNLVQASRTSGPYI